MTISDRQVWLALKRDTGSMVKVPVDEIKVDQNGTNLFLYKPASPRP